MGVLFVASLFITRLNREWHVDALLERAGKGGPIVAGAAFAIAWTPCIGPTLGAILSAAALSDSAARGAFLLAVYSAGLAIPFLLTALAFSRMTTAFAVVKRHYQLIVAVGGVILIAMGVLIWTGELTQLNIEAQNWLERRPGLLEFGLRGRRAKQVKDAESEACSARERPRTQDALARRLSTVSSSLPTASVTSRPLSSTSREQTMRKRPVPISPSGIERQAANLRPSPAARPRTGSSAPRPPGTGSSRCAGRSPWRSPPGSSPRGKPRAEV